MKKVILLSLLSLLLCGCGSEVQIEPTQINKGSITINSLSVDEDSVVTFQKKMLKVNFTNTTKDTSITVEWKIDGQRVAYDNSWTPKKSGIYKVSVRLFNTIDTVTLEKSIKVASCDFYFGRWYDTKTQITQYEDGVKSTELPLGYEYGDLIDRYPRYYFFNSSDELIKGVVQKSMQYNYTNTQQYILPLTLYNGEISALVNLYGNPYYSNFDYNKIVDKINTGRAVMNGLTFTVKFKNPRSNIECTLSRYTGSLYLKLGFTISTEYTPLK